ncbi:hypothetical protein ALC57_10326 [Trachymyrmex cornetzi]|uniref:Uncharacterized protein n=1 Tax=Trachymyrmex cornetzi TaxID=471704 RepID=A0A195DWR5_9HYME|nr:hypothetical protein ALC57_10326 [Trachymyrmex cornetzi]
MLPACMAPEDEEMMMESRKAEDEETWRKVSVVAVYSVTATCDNNWSTAKNHFGHIVHKEIRCGFSGPQPRETGYCRCRLSKPLITCFANAALGIALMMSPKYWINKLLHVKPLYLAKENSLLKTNFASNASWNFADNEVHASRFQSTARASREMSVNAARHQGHEYALGALKEVRNNYPDQTKRTKNDVSRELKHEARALKGKQRGRRQGNKNVSAPSPTGGSNFLHEFPLVFTIVSTRLR